MLIGLGLCIKMGEDKEPNFVREKEGLDAASPSVSNGSCDHLPLKPASVHGRITGPTRRSTKGGWTQKELNVSLIEQMCNACIAGRRFLTLILLKDRGASRKITLLLR